MSLLLLLPYLMNEMKYLLLSSCCGWIVGFNVEVLSIEKERGGA